MKKTPKILPHLYKSKDILNTALPFAQGGELIGPIKGKDKDKDKKSTKFKPKGNVAPFVTSDPEEYAYRKAAYDDSLHVANKYNSIMPKPESRRTYYNPFTNIPYLTINPRKTRTTIDTEDFARLDNLNKGAKSTAWEDFMYNQIMQDKKLYPDVENYPTVWETKSNYFPKNIGRLFGDSEEGTWYSDTRPRYQPPRQKIIFQEPPKPSKPPVKKSKVIQQKPVVNPEVIQPTPTPQPIPIPQPTPVPTPVIVNPELQKFVEERKPEPPGPPPGIGADVMPVYDTNELPMYATPDPDAEWIGKTKRYIDWDGTSVKYKVPRFKKPGHSGPLIKGTKTNYFHLPSIETRYQAEIVPEEATNSFANGGTIHFERSEYGSDAREHYDDGGPIYTYSKRPGSFYQRGADGTWMISNSSTGGQYVPIDDPSGQRTALLNKNAVVYNAPAQGPVKPAALRPTTALPQVNQKIYPGNPANFSETTQAVAAKTVPQSAEERANVEGARKDIAQRKSNLEKVLMTQGKTPEQAASIVGSYGSDWTTLEADNARALDTMARRAEAIQSGDTPDKMSEYVPRPEQSTLGFARDVLFNPFTAAGYAIRGQEIPDYMGEKIDNGTLGYWSNGQFVQGRNLLDTVVDAATPIGWAHSAYNIGEKALNNKSGDFWTEENAWDALNVLPGIGLAAKGMKYVPLANRVKFAPKSTAANLAVDAGTVAREPFYAPQRPSLLSPALPPTQQFKGIKSMMPAAPSSSFAYKNVTPSRVRAINTGLTNANVDTEVAKNIKWITSPEYAARRAANTGESLEEIQKSVSSIISDADKAKFNLNSNPRIMDLYEREGVMKSKTWWRPAKVEISANAGQPVQTLKHEVKHLYSPAIYNQNKLYDNYPTLGDAADDYLGIGAEQQVRHLNAREQILAENNLPIDAQLSEEQVREFVEGWTSKMNKRFKDPEDVSLREDYDDIWNEEGGRIQKEMLRARYNTDDLSFISKLPTSQKVKFMSEYRDRLTRSITKVLNKAWAAVLAVEGSALLNNSENQEENK